MNGKSSKNEGIQIIADFEDQAISLMPHSMPPLRSDRSSCSTNEGVRFLAEFDSPVTALHGTTGLKQSTLSHLMAQHEKNLHELIGDLQAKIEELMDQNAELKASVVGQDVVLHRFYLDGPNEDEI